LLLYSWLSFPIKNPSNAGKALQKKKVKGSIDVNSLAVDI